MATAGVPLWSTTAASNATADPAVNMAEGMAPSAVNDSIRALMASVANWRNDLYGITTGGTSTAFTITTGSTFVSTSDMSGAIFTIIPHATSGATPTLAVDGLTAYNLNVSTGVSVPTGALVLGTPYLVKYVHASTEFIVLNLAGKSLLTSLDIVNGTALTAPAVGDLLPIYDLDATANKYIALSDLFKVINGLTADSSPDTAADYVVTYDASATAAKKVLLQDIPAALPRGYIDGCILTNNASDTSYDIDIAAGSVRDSTNSVNITVAAMTKQIDSIWVAGTNAGMRVNASLANGTYHIYAVAKANGTQDIYAHTSATPATALAALVTDSGDSGWLYIRMIASILVESLVIVQFIQWGDYFRWKTIEPDYSDAYHTLLTTYTKTARVPTGIRVMAKINMSVWANGTTTEGFYVHPTDASDDAAQANTITDAALTALSAHGGSTSAFTAAETEVLTDTSGQYDVYALNSQYFNASTVGFYHQRGRDQ